MSHPILPFITLVQHFFRNIASKGTWHGDEWLSLFQSYRQTLLQRVDPKQHIQIQQQTDKITNFHFDLSIDLSQGEVHDFLGEVERIIVRNLLRGGAHFPTPQNPAMYKALGQTRMRHALF
jgi:hypothetical protein